MSKDESFDIFNQNGNKCDSHNKSKVSNGKLKSSGFAIDPEKSHNQKSEPDKVCKIFYIVLFLIRFAWTIILS